MINWSGHMLTLVFLEQGVRRYRVTRYGDLSWVIFISRKRRRSEWQSKETKWSFAFFIAFLRSYNWSRENWADVFNPLTLVTGRTRIYYLDDLYFQLDLIEKSKFSSHSYKYCQDFNWMCVSKLATSKLILNTTRRGRGFSELIKHENVWIDLSFKP